MYMEIERLVVAKTSMTGTIVQPVNTYFEAYSSRLHLGIDTNIKKKEQSKRT